MACLAPAIVMRSRIAHSINRDVNQDTEFKSKTKTESIPRESEFQDRAFLQDSAQKLRTVSLIAAGTSAARR